MSGRGSRVCALVSTLSAMVLAIPSVGIKATSRDPFRTRDAPHFESGDVMTSSDCVCAGKDS